MDLAWTLTQRIYGLLTLPEAGDLGPIPMLNPSFRETGSFTSPETGPLT